jgi:hypothetical protein
VTSERDRYYEWIERHVAPRIEPYIATWVAGVRAAQERQALVEQAVAEVAASQNVPGLVSVRCPTQGRSGCRRLLGVVVECPSGLLFTSRIKGRPDDDVMFRGEFPPWQVRERELRVNADRLDDFEFAVQARAWAQRGAPYGAPTHRGKPVTVVAVGDVLDRPGDWHFELWVRCEQHPADRHVVDREKLLQLAEQARATRQPAEYRW